jgi:hypothetical protein
MRFRRVSFENLLKQLRQVRVKTVNGSSWIFGLEQVGQGACRFHDLDHM